MTSKVDDFPARIPLDDAKRKVEALLASGRPGFQVSRDINKPSAQLADVGAVTKQFFETYPHVESESGRVVIGLDLIAPSEYEPGYISLGHIEDWDVVSKPKADEVFVVEGGPSDKEGWDRYPSIFHLLLWEASAMETERK